MDKKEKSPLEKEFKYYLKHQNEFVKKYEGKFIVIKDCKVIGDYDSDLEAIEKTSKKHEPGTFLVQKCTLGDQDFTSAFHSRVAFA